MRLTKRTLLNILASIYYFLSITISLLTSTGSRLGGFILIGLVLVILAIHASDTWRSFKVRLTFYHVNLLCFALFCIVSSLWALRPAWAVSKGIDILEILFAMAILYFVYQDDDNIDSLLKVIMYGSYLVVLYAVFYYGWRSFLVFGASARLSNEGINVNRLGMCAAHAIIINLYYLIRRKFRIWDLVMLPTVLVLAASGSRKGLVSLAAGVVGLIVLKNWKKTDRGKSLLKVVFIGAGLVAALLLVLQLPAFEGMRTRMMDLVNILFKGDYTRKNNAWIRLEYNKLGMTLFREKPILGIGIGSANVYTNLLYGHDHFLHNNYIEMLACGGIVGFVIYYSIYAVILARLIKFRRFRNAEYDVFLVLFLITMVMDYGMISYIDKNTYVILMTFWLESEILVRKGRGCLEDPLGGEIYHRQGLSLESK